MTRSARCSIVMAATIAFIATSLAAFASIAQAQVVTRNITLMSHWNEYPPQPNYPFGAGYASCWSYIAEDGREYAIIGTTYGTAIYNVTDPINSYRVAFIDGAYSAWREMKTYRNWLYIVTESPGFPPTLPSVVAGMQIVRMADPEHPVLAATYATNFQTSHTVTVDTTRALLFCNGTRFWSGNSGFARGMRVLSIANPEAPVELGWWPGGALPTDAQHYVHDAVVKGNRLYAAVIYIGTEKILDTTNPGTPTEIASWTYPGAFYTHNSWPDTSGQFLYVTDEQNGQSLRVFDLANIATPALVNTYSPNQQAIVHNAHVQGSELFLANYTEGIRILDISDPAHPAEFGYADSYPGTSGGFSGVWGVCPYFPSGTIVASDMQTGLYVYRPSHDYGLLRVKVFNANTLEPIPGVQVVVSTQAESLATPPDGIVQFAPDPGVQTVRVNAYGYDPVSATRMVSVGSRDSIEFALNPKQIVSLAGTVTDASTHAPLFDAEVRLAYSPLAQHTDSLGNYSMSGVADDWYQIEARRPGYIPYLYYARVGPQFSNTQDPPLVAAQTWDDLETDQGWTIGAAGDEATTNATGKWARLIPFGTSSIAEGTSVAAAQFSKANAMLASSEVVRRVGRNIESVPKKPQILACDGCDDRLNCLASGCACGCMLKTSAAPINGPVGPGLDRSPASASRCFITGQGSSAPSVDEADVDLGRTTLISPAYNMTGMTSPAIGYWRWFYANGDADDWLAVAISNDNGVNWTVVDTTRGLHNQWEERTVRVSDYVAPTAQVKLRFVAADRGFPSTVEAGIDDIITYDAATIVAVGPGRLPARLAFSAPHPNPARDAVSFSLALPRAGRVDVDVLDLTGRRVRTLHRGTEPAGALELRWDGADEHGRIAPAGVYYARARLDAERTTARFVRVR